MKIFRHKQSGKLYIMYYCKPPRILGQHYEAHPYKHDGKVLKFSDPDKGKNFSVVGISGQVPAPRLPLYNALR